MTKGNTIEDVYCPAKFKCTIKEHKLRDADDNTGEHHIIMYTTPDHEPIALVDADDTGSIY